MADEDYFERFIHRNEYGPNSMVDTRRQHAGRKVSAVLAAAGIFAGTSVYVAHSISSKRAGRQAATALSHINTPSSLPHISPSSAKIPNSPETSVSPTHARPAAKKLPYMNLPGYGKEVSPAAAEKLRAATVEIVVRAKGYTDSNPWIPRCMGTKVLINNISYILSANHCLFEIPEEATAKRAHAENITAQINQREYGVRTSETSPVAIIKDIVAGQVDMSLQKIDPHDPNRAVFDHIPAIPYDRPETTLDDSPVDLRAEAGSIGSSTVVMAGSNGKPVAVPRIYLGRIEDPGHTGAYADIWGETATSPNADNCAYGTSGSVVVTEDRRVSGPLEWRNNISPKTLIVNATNSDQDIATSLAFRDTIDLRLGYSTKNFDVVCGSAVTSSSIVQNAADAS